jgi:transcriptional regulator with XRE-family HTH domain
MDETAQPVSQLPSVSLRPLRLSGGLTIRELARLAEVAERTIIYAEHGRVPRPNVQRAIAAALTSALARPIWHTDLWPLSREPVA